MGLKESGLRGSLRNVSVGIGAIPDSEGTHQWNFNNWSNTLVPDEIGDLDLDFDDIGVGTGEGAGGTFGLLNDNFAELNNTDFESVREDAEGTFFAWNRLDDATDDRTLISSDRTSSGTDFYYGIDEDQYRFTLVLDDDFEQINSDESPKVDDWVAYAVVLDGSDMTMFLAEPPDYDLVQIGTAPVPSTTTQEWDTTPRFGQRGDGQFGFIGGVDLSFFDSNARTQAELQEIVDDSKKFYE